MRVCQPGPVAFQRAITSGGSRRLIICRGLTDLGLPAFLKTVLANISSVISGSSSYSSGWITCTSTRLRSEPKVRREAGLFTFVGLPHAENMAHFPTRCVPNDHQAATKQPEADDSYLSIVLPLVLCFGGQAIKDSRRILEVESSISQGPSTLGRVVGDAQALIVCTERPFGK
jgi:hypothetical protein